MEAWRIWLAYKGGNRRIEVQDEILSGEPLYRFFDENGNILFDKVRIEMITELIQAGTPLNKALFDIAMPSGLICMWSGSEVPKGWYLCDGTNGTPDLRNRFIVGAGNEYSIGDTGGEKVHTLTTAEMPKHTHTLTSAGEHTHTLYEVNGDSNYASYPGFYGEVQATISRNPITSIESPSSGLHTHPIASAGSGSAHENRPPYYALAFIMKA